MLSIVIVFSILNFVFLADCPVRYKCLDDKSDLSICAKRNITGDITTYYVRACPEGSSCPKDKVATSDSVKCETNQEEKTLQKVGENCAKNEDCVSGKCSNKKCEGKEDGEKCTNHYECSMISYCDETCKQIKSIGVPCAEDYECNMTAICSKNETYNNEKVCLNIHETEAGSKAEKQILCASNRMDSSNKCYETYPRNRNNEKENLTEGAECETDDDCPIYIDYGNEVKNGTGKCSCSYDGKKYCEYTSKSQYRYQKYLRYVEEIREEFENDTIIIDARENYYWDSWDVHKYVMKNDILYRNLPDCVFDYFVETGNYISLSLIVSLLSIILIF